MYISHNVMKPYFNFHSSITQGIVEEKNNIHESIDGDNNILKECGDLSCGDITNKTF